MMSILVNKSVCCLLSAVSNININKVGFYTTFLLLFFICTVEGFSQLEKTPNIKQLFQIEKDGNNTLQLERSIAYEAIRASEKTKHITHVTFPDSLYKYVRFSIYYDIKTERIVEETYPFAIELIVQRTDVQVLDQEKGYSWIGVISAPNAKDIIGSIHLVNIEQQIGGSLDIDGTTFEIQPLGSTKNHVLVQHNKEYSSGLCEIINKDGEKHMHHHSNSKKNFNSSSTNSVSPCLPYKQNVLVVYTANAAQGRNMTSLINTAIQETNEIYVNSQISNLRVRLAHAQQVSFNEGTKDKRRTINELIIDPQINALRNTYNADLVMLIVDSDLYAGGRAATILASDTSKAYAFTDVNDMNAPNYIFAHELGHLQGAQHHPSDEIEENGPFSYGFGHRFSYISFLNPIRKKKATIMANENPNTGPFPKQYERIKFFSNPYVTYRGKHTGIVNERDNHRVLETTAAQIASLKDPNGLNQLNGTIAVSPGIPPAYTFSANTCGGNGTISYEWAIGSSPNTYFLESTSPTFSKFFPGGTHFIRLKLTSGSQTVTRYYTLFAPNTDPCDDTLGEPCEVPFKQKHEIIADLPTKTEINQTYPNPFNPTTNIRYSLTESQHIKLEVYNLNGTKVATLAEGFQVSGQYNRAFNAQNLPSGTYLVRMQTEQSIFTQKITLIK